MAGRKPKPKGNNSIPSGSLPDPECGDDDDSSSEGFYEEFVGQVTRYMSLMERYNAKLFAEAEGVSYSDDAPEEYLMDMPDEGLFAMSSEDDDPDFVAEIVEDGLSTASEPESEPIQPNSVIEELPKAKKVNRKKTNVNCRVEMFTKTVKELPSWKLEVVKAMGFGSLLGLRIESLNRCFCMWLYDKFDPEINALVLDAKREEVIYVTANLVSWILGISTEGLVVPSSVSELTAHQKKLYQEIKVKYKYDQGVPLQNVLDEVVREDISKEDFRIAFLLFVLITILNPTQCNKGSPMNVCAATVAANCEDYAFGEFTFDRLMGGGLKFSLDKKCKETGAQGTAGCALVFVLLYLDRKPLPLSVMWYRKPRIHAWSDNAVKEAILLDTGEEHNADEDIWVYGKQPFMGNLFYGGPHPREAGHCPWGGVASVVPWQPMASGGYQVTGISRTRITGGDSGASDFGANDRKLSKRKRKSTKFGESHVNGKKKKQRGESDLSNLPNTSLGHLDPKDVEDAENDVIRKLKFPKDCSDGVADADVGMSCSLKSQSKRDYDDYSGVVKIANFYTDTNVGGEENAGGEQNVPGDEKAGGEQNGGGEENAWRTVGGEEQNVGTNHGAVDPVKTLKSDAEEIEGSNAEETFKSGPHIQSSTKENVGGERSSDEAFKSGPGPEIQLSPNENVGASTTEEAYSSGPEKELSADKNVATNVPALETHVVVTSEIAAKEKVGTNVGAAVPNPTPCEEALKMGVENQPKSCEQLENDKSENGGEGKMNKTFNGSPTDCDKEAMANEDENVPPSPPQHIYETCIDGGQSHSRRKRTFTDNASWEPWEPNNVEKMVIDYVKLFPSQGTSRTRLKEQNAKVKDVVVLKGDRYSEYVDHIKSCFFGVGQVDSHLVRVATDVYNRNRLWNTNGVKRMYMLSPEFMQTAISKTANGTEVYDLDKIQHIGEVQRTADVIRTFDFNRCSVFFVPCCFQNHWFCYAFAPRDNRIGLLDSMYSFKEPFHLEISKTMLAAFAELLNHLKPGWGGAVFHWEIIDESVPRQLDNHSCGIRMLLAIRLWDGRWVTSSPPQLEEYYRHCSEFLLCKLLLDDANLAKSDLMSLIQTAPNCKKNSPKKARTRKGKQEE